ncbi:hypothetical protein B0T13DRAFT_447027 [Neurospora crassa]|nr:hypothetical protein B0T13DRAFT_447027 [Neurospora crassa]
MPNVRAVMDGALMCLTQHHHYHEPKPKGCDTSSYNALVSKGSMSLMNRSHEVPRTLTNTPYIQMNTLIQLTKGIKGSIAGQSVIQSPSTTPGFKRHGRFRHLPFGSSYEVPLGSYVNGNLAATSVPTYH